MTKVCDFCTEPLLDGEVVSFIGLGHYRQLESKIAYAIGKNFEISEIYHRECLNYVMSGGR